MITVLRPPHLSYPSNYTKQSIEALNQCLSGEDYHTYLKWLDKTDYLDALRYFISKGVKDLSLYKYVYAHSDSNYTECMSLLDYFDSEGLTKDDINKLRPTLGGLVKVYRGESKGSIPLMSAYSWTKSREVALNFAHFNVDCRLHTGYVHIKDIKFIIWERGEYEIICDSKDVQHITTKVLYFPYKEGTYFNYLTKQGLEDTFDGALSFMLLQLMKYYSSEKIALYKDEVKDVKGLSERLLNKYGDFYKEDHYLSVIGTPSNDLHKECGDPVLHDTLLDKDMVKALYALHTYINRGIILKGLKPLHRLSCTRHIVQKLNKQK